MIKKTLLIVFISFITYAINGQNLTEGNKREGKWIQKDERDLVFAEGTYKEGIKIGRWWYFVSPISRYANSPDVEGSYNENGKKTGTWIFVSSTTKIRVDAQFVDGIMQGKCSYHAPNGDIMAEGLVNNGFRHGKWVFYHKDHKMSEGYYQNGLKIGDWAYDYYPEKNLHIKGAFNFDNGYKNGQLEFYKIDYHPKFGTNELLSGIGTYSNGKKTGRWIEYSQGLKGEFVETGDYNQSGQRHGYWKSTIGKRNYQAAMYDNGILNGVFKQYHDNGKLKYQTNFANGLATGRFTHFFRNGNTEEKGTTVFSSNTSEVIKDTIYYFLNLPYEYHFELVELDDFQHLDHHYIDWITDPGYSIDPTELVRHFEIYKDYGHEPHKRIINIKIIGRKSVRKGPYQAFYKSGKLKLEGAYYPKVSEVFDPESNTVITDFTRDGEWKQYDENGYIMRTLTYDKGELIKILDDKGNEIGIDSNAVSN
ncbi:hypothetical protein OAK19_00115 [Aureispira]|nr:hypothetical protein [Aureispira sp.]